LPRLPQLPSTRAPIRKDLTLPMVYDLTPALPAGPTDADLAAIETEWPLIEAEMALVDAEIRMLTVQGAPSPLDWRRLRRAEARVMREALALAALLPLSDLAA
jgi:Family of unknown function (DUF6284)